MEFSFFEAPISNTTPSKTVQLENVYNYILTNKNAQKATHEYRNTSSQTDKKAIKGSRFNFVTFSGKFSQRQTNSLIAPAPLVCLDLDAVEDPGGTLQTLTSDTDYPPTLAFISPSGKGVKLVYAVDLDKGDHKTYYGTISGHLSREYDLEVDSSPSSVASACFLPYDPKAYFDKSCPTVSLPESKQPKGGGIDFQQVRRRNQAASSDKDLQLVEACVGYIEKNALNIADDYDEWINQGFALTQLGEDGRHLFHRVSAESSKYEPQECEERYNQLLKDSQGKITLGTFFDACKKYEVPVDQLRRELRLSPPKAEPEAKGDTYDFGERDEYEVRVDDELEEEQVCLGMVDFPLALSGQTEPMKIATLGNFSTWIGKAKSRKTFLISMFVAAALQGGRFQRQIHAEFPEGKRRVLVFDTEQGSNDVLRVQRRIAKLAGKDSQFMRDHIKVFALRALTPRERLETIEEMLAKHEGYGLVVIDGIRDLVSSINDEDQATMVASRLLRWTQEYQIHIMGVLHMNKGDRNARGHLGTEVVNKSESVISVTKNDATTSTVDPEYMRGKEFIPFTFSVDEDGLPYLSGAAASGQSGPSKFTPGDVPVADHQKFLSEVFAEQQTLMHTTLWKGVYNKLGDRFDFGQSKAKQFPGWYVEQGLLKVEEDGNKKLYRLADSD